MANPKKKSSKKADAADSDSQEKKRALFQKATGHLGLNPDDPELKAIVEWVRSKGKTDLAPPQSDLDKKRELFQKAAGLLGYHPDESDRDCIYPDPQGFDPENIIED